MKYFSRLLTLFLLIFITSISFAEIPTQAEISKLSALWGQTLAERNPQKIADLYDKDALLYATFSNLINTHDGILQYFVKLTKNKDLKVNFTQQSIRPFDDVALNSGTYEFSYTNDQGKTVRVPARYTFVYYKTPAGWKIIDHHSSAMPEK